MSGLSPLKLPNLVFVIGVPGSGKSSVARALAAETHSVYLCSDFIAEELYGDDRVSETYVMLRDRVYDIIYRLAEENLQIGNDVLIDAPMARALRYQAVIDKIKGVVSRAEARLHIFRCHCSESVLRQRITDRGEARDKEKLDDWEGFMADQPVFFPVPFEHTDIGTERPLSESVADCLAVLRLKE